MGFHPVDDLFGGKGQYKTDDYKRYNNNSLCIPVESNTCITECILNYDKIFKVPNYNLLFHNCRDEALDIYFNCQNLCK